MNSSHDQLISKFQAKISGRESNCIYLDFAAIILDGHSSIELTVKQYGRWAGESKEQWTWTALRGQSVGEVAQGLVQQ